MLATKLVPSPSLGLLVFVLFLALFSSMASTAGSAMSGEDMRQAEQTRPIDPELAKLQQGPINRQTYIDYIKRQPPHGNMTGLYSEAFLNNPRRGQYAPRHAFPALALFVATGDQRFGEAVKVSLEDFYRVLQAKVAQDG